MSGLHEYFKTYLRQLQEESQARLFWEAERGLSAFPFIVKSEAFSILSYFMANADFSQSEPRAFFSYPRLEESFGWKRGKIQAAIQELVARKVVGLTSGKFQKEGALRRRKEYFESTNPTRSYYETNAYSLLPAVQLGLFLSFLRTYAREHSIPLAEIEAKVRKEAREHREYIKNVCERWVPRMRDIWEHYEEIPSLLEWLSQNLNLVPQALAEPKPSNQDKPKEREIYSNSKSGEEIYSNSKSDLHNSKCDLRNSKSDLQITVKAKLSPNTLSPKNQFSKTHTQAAEKNRSPSPKSDADTPADAEPKPQTSEPPPADQLPEPVYEALLDHLSRQENIKNPIAVLKRATQKDIEAMAKEVLRDFLRGDTDLRQEIQRLPDLSAIDLLEYALLSDEGRLKWIEEKGISLEPDTETEVWSEEKIEQTIREVVQRIPSYEQAKKVLKSIFRTEPEKEKLKEVWKRLKKEGRICIDKDADRIEWRFTTAKE